MISDHSFKRVPGHVVEAYLHGVLILAGEGIDGTLLDTLLTL